MPGVKDSAVLAGPALPALHLVHLPHSYRKISTDLPSCAGMALMESGPPIRDGRVFGSQQVQRNLCEPCPHARTEQKHTHIDMWNHSAGQLINLWCFKGEANGGGG